MNDSVKSLVEVSTRTIHGKEVLAVTSLQVAKHFEKEHKHVLRDIRIILEADEDGFSESNFGLSSYLTEQNKEMGEFAPPPPLPSLFLFLTRT